MKAAVVYYSYTGTTKWYLEQIAEEISVDLIEIKPRESLRSTGLKCYIQGGSQSFRKTTPGLMPYDFDGSKYDFIIIASPVWAFTFAPPIRSFLKKETITGKKVSFFITHQGAPGATAKHFEKMLKDNEIIQGLDINTKKKKEENLPKVKKWANNLF